MNQIWNEADSKTLFTQNQAACLIDIVLIQSGVADIKRQSHRLLAGTGIFYEDLKNLNSQLSAIQYDKLIENCQGFYKHNDLGFLFGNRIWSKSNLNTHTLLQGCNNLREVLLRLESCSAQLTPMLRPALQFNSDYSYLYWNNGFGSQNSRFLAIANAAALAALFKRGITGDPKCQYHFSQPSPKEVEQYHFYLGQENVFFSAHDDYIKIPAQHLALPFDNTEITQGIGKHQLFRTDNKEFTLSPIMHVIHQYIFDNIDSVITLESCSEHFQLSPATLKRKLKKHHSSFQVLLDQIRLRESTRLLRDEQWSNDQVAQHLNFSDSNNFRRAFKRWTGQLPSDYRFIS